MGSTASCCGTATDIPPSDTPIANIGVQQLTDICVDEIVPQIGHEQLSQNVEEIRSFLFKKDIDSNKLFSMAPNVLRENLETHSGNALTRWPTEKLFRALKQRIKAMNDSVIATEDETEIKHFDEQSSVTVY